MSKQKNIQTLVKHQRQYFNTGITKDIGFRRLALDKLSVMIEENEDAITAALKADLNKSPFEAYMTEISILKDEIKYARRNLRRWSRPKRVRSSLMQFPAKSRIYSEPYGVTLIMSPWNYPLMLTLDPLVGAIAAGNTAVIKPSAYAPETSQVIAKMIADYFPPEYICVVQGGRQENQDLLQQRFDYIFFTGGVEVGRLVMESAARHVTPVSLELGGKSPVIVDETADLDLAAKRIAFGKLLNAGQTCVAPDYLYVHHSVKDALLTKLAGTMTAFYGTDAVHNDSFPKIVNEKHYRRLCAMLEDQDIYYGGEHDAELNKIAPTILDHITRADKCMQEEIFGPILPVLSYDSLDSVFDEIKAQEKPLAAYYFSSNRLNIDRFLNEVSFGGGCVNDTILHLAGTQMPFGGVGYSGMGGYHGRYSFDTFSHKKSVLKKSTHCDIPIRYAPWSQERLDLIKKIL